MPAPAQDTRPTGEWVKIQGSLQAFLPRPLPPQPALAIDASQREILDDALLALGRLDSLTTLLPDPALFIYMYVRKEAVLSSQIEGTQSSLADLLLSEVQEAPGVPMQDVIEISNYVVALDHGLQRIREGFPLSNRLLREIHAILLSRGRGAGRARGEFRRTQNWIGGSRPENAVFVPPPPNRVEDAMAAFEQFLHDIPQRTPPLIKAALAHAQFETIHPFLDGNGRLGRLLITLLLCHERVLREPLLYVSLYLKTHRDEYYQRLQSIRLNGDWEGWLAFFGNAVRETAEGAVNTARQLIDLFREDRNRIQAASRRTGSVLRVHHALVDRPLAPTRQIAEATKLTVPTVKSALEQLIKLGIVREITGRRWRRLYSYSRYIAILNEGTEVR